MPRFTFGQVEALLAEANDIAPDKRQAFSARLKHLQRQGLRGEGAQPGRGRAATQTFGEVMQLALAVELLKAGLPPQRAAQLVRLNWGSIRYSVFLSMLTRHDADQIVVRGSDESISTEWLWLVRADALAELTTAGDNEYDAYEAIEAVDLKGLSRLLDVYSHGGDPQGRRTLLIHGTALTRSVLHQAAHRFHFATIDEMRDDISHEVRAASGRFENFDQLLEGAGPGLTQDERAEMAAMLKKYTGTDGSNPQRPQSRLEEKARAILRTMSAPAVDLLVDMQRQLADNRSAQLTMGDSREAMKELFEHGIIDIASQALADPESPVPQMEISPLGTMAMNLAAEQSEADDVDPEA